MKIAIIGCGYVGFANAILFAKHHKVALVDVDEQKVKDLSNGICPIQDESFTKAFNKVKKNINSTVKLSDGVNEAKLVVVAVPSTWCC